VTQAYTYSHPNVCSGTVIEWAIAALAAARPQTMNADLTKRRSLF